ncbi:MAG: N-acetylmuramoyl-L-alanine amidase [Deltaproteobacteria bacterium]|nr:N-acetylmuramoyl-L-alanine amidase [Deltaproteobacteria bacterium]MCB9786817.1 N-acetylmuramoyl-L-alanine amidase [Deltaproteobacteria bacterium]
MRACGLLLVMLAVACGEAPAPVGPPRCEPPEELVLERGLKEGFRALLDEDREAAQAAFERVLAVAPDHPEALAGQRLLRDRPARAAATPPPPAGHIVLSGQPVAVAVPVNTDTYRFEEKRAQVRLAREMNLRAGEGPTASYYRPRRNARGEEIPPEDTERLRALIDLVVLHDSLTETARESFLRLGETGGSTHFTIDYDGTIYQNLDLAYEATHSGDASVDGRSVSIDLVNPATTSRPPLPEDATLDRFARPLSDFERVQGEEVQQWGYTEQQLSALAQLLHELARALPALPLSVPPAALGERRAAPEGPLALRGIVGHLHLSRRASDPGPGFDWQALSARLH